MNGNLSQRSSYFRYFGLGTALSDAEMARILVADTDRLSLVGLIDDDPVALAEVDGLDPAGPSEIALSVDDAHQGLGVGTLLLLELAQRAAEHGVQQLFADVLPDNRMMLEVFANSGFRTAVTLGRGADRVVISLAPHQDPERPARFA